MFRIGQTVIAIRSGRSHYLAIHKGREYLVRDFVVCPKCGRQSIYFGVNMDDQMSHPGTRCDSCEITVNNDYRWFVCSNNFVPAIEDFGQRVCSAIESQPAEVLEKEIQLMSNILKS